MTLFLLSTLFVGPIAYASDYFGGGYYQTTVQTCNKSEMYRELDRATARARAVTTVVKCAHVPVQVQQQQKNVMAERRHDVRARCAGECGQAFEKVVDREYFVRETREVYKPVVTYVPAGTYTTTRKVCESDLACN